MTNLVTFNCPLPGYEPLEITIDAGMTQEQLDIARRNGVVCPAVKDFPNWEEAAVSCGLVAVDPETGERTSDPLPKPTFPLVDDVATKWGMDLVMYLPSDDLVRDALKAYREQLYPNSSRR